MKKIEADWKKLMEDASGATRYYFSDAIDVIDSKFGKGYAKEHPDLVGQFIKSAVLEYGSNCIAKALYDIAENANQNR